MKKFISLTFAALMILIIAGCSEETSPPEETILYIGYPQQHIFYQKYAKEFEDLHPEIDIRIIQSNPEDQLNHPEIDVYFINDLDLYHSWSQSQKLTPLNAYIQDHSELADIHPVVTELLTGIDGQIYGLSPRFSGQALYYNLDLFEKYNVPIPADHMTWFEILELAKQFPAETDGITGLQMNFFRDIPFLLIREIGLTHGLNYIDPKTLEIQMNTSEWKEIWDEVLQAFQSGAIYDKEMGSSFSEPFFEGNIALTPSRLSFAYNLLAHFDELGTEPFQWGIVTMPVNPAHPASDDYYIHDIFAIADTAEHKQAAWKFLHYIGSKPFAREHAVDPTFINDGFPIYTEYIQEIDGNDLSAFYTLPIADDSHYPQNNIDFEILKAFDQIATQQFYAVLDGQKTLEQALEDLEVTGQQAVDSAKIQVDVQNELE